MANIRVENRTFKHYYNIQIRDAKAANSKKTFISIYNTYIKAAIPHRALIRDVLSKHIDAIIDPMQARRLSPSTIQGVVSILSRTFKYCLERELIFESPVKLRHTKIKPNPLHQKKIILDAAAKYAAIQSRLVHGNYDAQTHVVIRFLLHARRICEVLSFKWKDIDLKNNVYLIRAANNKTAVDTTFHMDDNLKAALVLLKESYVFSLKNNDFLFYHIQGQYEGQNLKNASVILKNFRGSEFPTLVSHDFRRIVATKLINAGENPENIMSILGHLSSSELRQYMTINNALLSKIGLTTLERL